MSLALTTARRVLAAAVALALLLLWAPGIGFGKAHAATADPSGVSFGLQGCRLPAGETLPNAQGKYICNDADYSPGNQGKNWAELDLVPFRLTASAGNSAPASQTYAIGITADAMDAGHPGYDIISVPVLNTALSSASCTALSANPSGGVGQAITPGVGGIDESLGRVLTITQLKNTTCVYDYYERLALGSHLFPGSSLHSNLTDQSYSTSGSGAKDVPIPVKEILPQELGKSSSATQGEGNAWNITKTYSNVGSIANTCLADSRSATASLRVAWTKTTQASGDVVVTSNVTATNPASRTITVSVTDVLYPGSAASGTPLTALSGGDTNPSAAQSFDVGSNSQHTFTFTVHIASGTQMPISDKATASYTDKATGVAVPGNTTATAIVSTVTPISANSGNSAIITDVEHLADYAHFTLAATQVNTGGSTSGTFQNGYTAGAPGTQDITWKSGTVTSSGFADFTKTVTAAGAYVPADGTIRLSDTATANDAVSQAVLDSQSQHTDISVAASTVLTVHKHIPFAYDSNDGSVTFSFPVSSGGGVVATPTITFDSSKGASSSTTVNLAPGTYSVGETTTAPYDAQSAQTADMTLPNHCTNSVTFTNDYPRATAEVQKATDPVGNEAGWTFTLTGPGLPQSGIQATTTDAGAVTFEQNGSAFNLTEGTYTITESPNGPYDNTAIMLYRDGQQVDGNQIANGFCSFTVDYPGDTGAVYRCAFTNTKHAEIIVNKATVPSSDTTTSFPFTESGPGSFSRSFSLMNGGSDDTGFTVPPGSGYSVAEGPLPAGWSQTAVTCTRAGSEGTFSPSSFDLAPGDVVTCDFTNTHRVSLTISKAIVGNGDSVPPAGFVFSVSCSDGTHATVTFHEAGSQEVTGILEGATCDVTETPTTGWTVTPATTRHVTIGPNGATAAFTNTRDLGVITVTKATSGAVAGASTVFTFDVVCPTLPEFNQTLTIDTATQTSATSTHIPTGTVCTVTERSTPGWQQTTPAVGGTDVTVPGTAAFVNTRLTGPLQLSKSVTPTTGSYDAGAPGNMLTYTLTLKPTGALDHTNVVVTDYIPGYDPSDVDSTGKQKSGKTVYVAGSATCSTGCTATYNATTHLLTWNVGDVPHDSVAILLGFKVTIVKPASTPQSGIPAEVIDNIGFVQSLQQAKTPSNKVQVPVLAVLGVKVVKPPVQVLPFTGVPIPVQPVALAAMALIGAGLVMASTRRRRTD